MKTWNAFLFVGLLLAAGCTSDSRQGEESPAPEEAESPLARAISERLAETGAEFAVAYRDLQTRDELLIHPDAEFHAASMMKVPVMLRLHRMADWRQLMECPSVSSPICMPSRRIPGVPRRAVQE